MKYLSATIVLIILLTHQGCKQPAMHNADIDWESESLFGPDDGLMSIGVAGPVTGVIGDVFIVAGGANFPEGMPWDGGVKRYQATGAVYRYSPGKAIDKVFPFSLPDPLAYAACISTPKGIVYAGGENQNGAVRTVGLITVDVHKKSVLIDSLPDLPYAATNASLAFDGTVLYFVGGENKDSVHGLVLALDLNHLANGWNFVAKMPQPRTNASVGCQRINAVSNLIIVGGRLRQTNEASQIFETAYRLNLETLNWIVCAPFPTTIAAGSYLNLPDTGLLLIGGDLGKLYQQTELLIQAVASESDSSEKRVLQSHRKNLQQTHPGFTNQVWLYQPANDQWRKLGEVPFPTPVTSTAIQQGPYILIPSGELKPGIRSTKLIIGHLPALNNEQ
jgi:N-acetylneuraminate epimerase